MFYFVVRYLRWAAKVPGFPQLFDACLLAGSFVFRRSRIAAMENLETEAVRLLGARLKSHRFGGTEFVDERGRELGHLHGNGLLDVPVGVQKAIELVASLRVQPHHVFPRSKWVSFQLQSETDVPFALELLLAGKESGIIPSSAPRLRRLDNGPPQRVCFVPAPCWHDSIGAPFPLLHQCRSVLRFAHELIGNTLARRRCEDEKT